MGSMFSMMDLLIAGCGVYVLYVYYMLKFKGEIKETLLLPKGTNVKKCKDKEAYIAQMSPKVLLYGVVVLASGIFGVLEDQYQLLGNGYLLVIVVFGGFTVWFGLMSKKAFNKFW